MDEMQNTNNTENTYRLHPAAAVFLGLLAAVFAAFIPTTLYGSLFCMVISSAALALLLIAEHSFLAFLPIPAGYVIAVVLTGDPLYSIAAFAAVPAAFAIRVCFAKKTSLSVTVIAASVFTGLSFALIICNYLKYNAGSVTEGFRQIKSAAGSAINDLFAEYNKYNAETGAAFPEFTDEMVSLLKKTIIMTAPGMYAILVEAAAYATEKLMRLLALITRCTPVTGRRQRITLGLGAAIIFLVSYAVSSFIPSDSVVFYTAENLMLIVLPLAAVAGIHNMFGTDSIFRRRGRVGLKILTVGLCVMALYVSPVMLFILFALWGSAGAVGRAILLFALSHRE